MELRNHRSYFNILDQLRVARPTESWICQHFVAGRKQETLHKVSRITPFGLAELLHDKSLRPFTRLYINTNSDDLPPPAYSSDGIVAPREPRALSNASKVAIDPYESIPVDDLLAAWRSSMNRETRMAVNLRVWGQFGLTL